MVISIGLGWFVLATLLRGEAAARGRVASRCGVGRRVDGAGSEPRDAASTADPSSWVVAADLGCWHRIRPWSGPRRAGRGRRSAPAVDAGSGSGRTPMSGSWAMPGSAPSGSARPSACSATGCTRSRWASWSTGASPARRSAAGFVFLAATLPNLLLGPIAGTFVDRWDHKRVMIVSDLIRAGLVLLIPVVFEHQRPAGVPAGVPGHDRQPVLPTRAGGSGAAHRAARGPAGREQRAVDGRERRGHRRLPHRGPVRGLPGPADRPRVLGRLSDLPAERGAHQLARGATRGARRRAASRQCDRHVRPASCGRAGTSCATTRSCSRTRSSARWPSCASASTLALTVVFATEAFGDRYLGPTQNWAAVEALDRHRQPHRRSRGGPHRRPIRQGPHGRGGLPVDGHRDHHPGPDDGAARGAPGGDGRHRHRQPGVRRADTDHLRRGHARRLPGTRHRRSGRASCSVR